MQKYREKQQKLSVKEFWTELSNRYIAEGKNISAMIGVFIAGMKDKLHDPVSEKAICKLGEAAENTTPMFVATLIAHDPNLHTRERIIEIDKSSRGRLVAEEAAGAGEEQGRRRGQRPLHQAHEAAPLRAGQVLRHQAGGEASAGRRDPGDPGGAGGREEIGGSFRHCRS